MKRLVALLVAVGLVGGAWYLRSNVIDDDGGGDPSAPSGDAPTLICSTEMGRACSESGYGVADVEDPGDTYARLLQGGDLGADAWLVSQPWVDMLNQSDHPIGKPSKVLARTPLQLAVVQPRPAGLNCQPTTWKCVGDYSIAGGTFAHDSDATTPGLLTTHALASGFIGDTNYASNDFEEVDGFKGWFSQVEAAVEDTRRPGNLLLFLQTARGTYTAVSALGVEMDLKDGFEVTTPAPEITADAVLAGHPDRFDRAEISDALFTTGWLRSGDNDLPATNGLPNPGVMVALRDLSK